MLQVIQKTTLPLAVAAISATASVCAAGEVTLTSVNQTFSITGEFVGFRDGAYIIVYQDQELYVPAGAMTCEGSDCLAFQTPVQQPASVRSES